MIWLYIIMHFYLFKRYRNNLLTWRACQTVQWAPNKWGGGLKKVKL